MSYRNQPTDLQNKSFNWDPRINKGIMIMITKNPYWSFSGTKLTCFIYIVIHCFVFSNNFSGRAAGPLLLFTCWECTSLNVSLVILKFEKKCAVSKRWSERKSPLGERQNFDSWNWPRDDNIGMAETVCQEIFL